MPVARLAQAAKAAHPGTYVMVDGAHAPGMLHLSVGSYSGVDWYVGNLHKWCFTLKGVALLYAADGVRESLTQGSIISHFWKGSFSERFFMQGTLDYSRYLSAPEALDWVGGALGGLGAMREYNTALAEAGAALLARAWGGALRMLEPSAALAGEGIVCPFLAVVVTPLDWRAWGETPGGGRLGNLEEAAALEALEADHGLPERIANAVFKVSGVQSVFWKWRVNGRCCIMNRISAQVYNTLGDYERLAAAVLQVHRERK
jgi:isopenicillin-N epimerase